MKKDVWKKIGIVGVDSGQLVITDPCYIDSEWRNENFVPGKKPKHPFSYSATCHVTDSNDLGGQLKYKLGHPGVAVAMRTGFGDGCYPVFARYKNFGKWGKRVVELRIVFVGDEE